MKTAEELNTLKEKAETGNKNICLLTDEELSQVSGGAEATVIGTHLYGDPNYPNIWFDVLSTGNYVMRNIVTKEERIVENASEFDVVAAELSGG